MNWGICFIVTLVILLFILHFTIGDREDFFSGRRMSTAQAARYRSLFMRITGEYRGTPYNLKWKIVNLPDRIKDVEKSIKRMKAYIDKKENKDYYDANIEKYNELKYGEADDDKRKEIEDEPENKKYVKMLKWVTNYIETWIWNYNIRKRHGYDRFKSALKSAKDTYNSLNNIKKIYIIQDYINIIEGEIDKGNDNINMFDKMIKDIKKRDNIDENRK